MSSRLEYKVVKSQVIRFRRIENGCDLQVNVNDYLRRMIIPIFNAKICRISE